MECSFYLTSSYITSPANVMDISKIFPKGNLHDKAITNKTKYNQIANYT